MGGACYRVASAVLLLVNLERTSSLQAACSSCAAGLFRVKKECSSTGNTECECISGFRCLGPGCSQCEPDCQPGQEFTGAGCADCSFGTFNDQGSNTCRPWTNCSSDGKSVLVMGTRTRDVICGPALAVSSPGPSPQGLAVFAVLMAATALALLFVFILRLSVVRWSRKPCLHIFKRRPFKAPARTAQEEDGCSCGFPQEEEGGGHL
ncbi:tumor necrosis factor receptor superfamily member 9 isoform X2 [Perognathus longimembris pacificus]|uniref:tumor necrosis factor receptor superfamily member 9 isoform X2 n=1 Tax=Perognathus longimembris pacificus TaxID=214514 RepID=UPI002018B755|nr:tumor necrosis factor receptor superfamily member 9 isoform X2 [Perognathus longimembris pacificus]